MFTNFEEAQFQQELKKWIVANQKLSAAYLRLRALIPGAFDTPHAPSSEEVWQVTENALKNLLARVEIRDKVNVS